MIHRLSCLPCFPRKPLEKIVQGSRSFRSQVLRICFERRTILADGPEARVDEKEEEVGRRERN